MASFELREPKKKPRYYKLIANVLVNGKIERRYGRFDFDPTELKNARARNAAAKAAAAEFERLEQEKADKEASNAGKTFAVVAQEYIASNRSRMAPSVRLKGDYDSNRNKENTSLKKEKIRFAIFVAPFISCVSLQCFAASDAKFLYLRGRIPG